MKEKKTIKVSLEEFDRWNFEGSLDSVIEMLKQYEDKYSAEYSNLKLVYEYGKYDDGDSSCYHALYGYREETDKEYEKRIAEEKKERAKKKAETQAKKDKEYGEYMRLKAKFEGEK